MSKTRNEMQKARRVYLAKCKKDGVNPISAEEFNKEYQKKLGKKADKPVAKVAKKSVKAVKNVAKKTVKKRKPIEHYVYEGDIIRFRGFTPDRIARYALNLLTSAIESVIK